VVKFKPDSALLSIRADLPACAHLAGCAVPAAVRCPGFVHFILKARLFHGTQTPSPWALTHARYEENTATEPCLDQNVLG